MLRTGVSREEEERGGRTGSSEFKSEGTVRRLFEDARGLDVRQSLLAREVLSVLRQQDGVLGS
jgi:hypothetical protein